MTGIILRNGETRLLQLIGLLFCCAVSLSAANPAAGSLPIATDLPLAEILDRMARAETARRDQLQHYTSTRTYFLHNRRFGKKAEMTVRLTYRHPGVKNFEVLSESGPEPVRERVLRRMIQSEAEVSRDEERRLNQITTKNYDLRFMRMDRNEGRSVYVLSAVPKAKSKYLMEGEVWLDAEDFAIVRIEGRPAKNPSFWIRDSRFAYQFAKFGDFWMPVSTDSEATAIVFGHTEVKIRYLDYQINNR